jgi:DNA-binding transcriptional regulator YhcF (GntR family)
LSLPQFLALLHANGTVIRTGHGIYALPGSAPVYVSTCDAIISALTKKTMKLGPLVQHVNKSTKSTRSPRTIRTALSRLKKQGTVKQDRRSGEYRLAPRVRAVRGRESTARRKGLVKEPPRAELG